MRVGMLVVAFGWVAVALALAQPTATEADRAKWDEMFRKQRDANAAIVERYPEPATALKRFVDNDEPGSEGKKKVGSAVRVWAELCNPTTRLPTGTYVSLTRYTWRKEQPFLLHFECTVPMRLWLYNLGDDITDPPQVLPDDTVPKSKDPYAVGKVHTTFRMRASKDGKNESIQLYFQPDGMGSIVDKKLKIYDDLNVRGVPTLKPRLFVDRDELGESQNPAEVADYASAPPRPGGGPREIRLDLILTKHK